MHALVLLFLFSTSPTLAGKWEMVPAQSNFGSAPKPQSMTAEASVQNDVVHGTLTIGSPQGNRNIDFTWYLDGKRHETGKEFTITHWEDNTLVNDTESKDGAMKRIDRITLSPDRKTATEIVTSKTPNGTNREKLLWRKVGD